MFHSRIFVNFYGENVLSALQNVPLTTGFAPGPHWGLRPQTPVIGSLALLRSP